MRQKRTCKKASTSVSQQTAVSSTFGVLACMKTIKELITELLFAGGCALLAHTEEALQHIVKCFSDAAKNFSLTISLKKTEVLYQPPPRVAYSPPHINIDGTNLNAVEHFIYLVVSSPMMQQSARILTPTCPKPAVPLEDGQREYGRATHSASP